MDIGCFKERYTKNFVVLNEEPEINQRLHTASVTKTEEITRNRGGERAVPAGQAFSTPTVGEDKRGFKVTSEESNRS